VKSELQTQRLSFGYLQFPLEEVWIPRSFSSEPFCPYGEETDARIKSKTLLIFLLLRPSASKSTAHNHASPLPSCPLLCTKGVGQYLFFRSVWNGSRLIVRFDAPIFSSSLTPCLLFNEDARRQNRGNNLPSLPSFIWGTSVVAPIGKITSHPHHPVVSLNSHEAMRVVHTLLSCPPFRGTVRYDFDEAWVSQRVSSFLFSPRIV